MLRVLAFETLFVRNTSDEWKTIGMHYSLSSPADNERRLSYMEQALADQVSSQAALSTSTSRTHEPEADFAGGERHVKVLLGCHRRETTSSRACVGSLPHHAEVRQSAGRDPRRRGAWTQACGPRALLELAPRGKRSPAVTSRPSMARRFLHYH